MTKFKIGDLVIIKDARAVDKLWRGKLIKLMHKYGSDHYKPPIPTFYFECVGWTPPPELNYKLGSTTVTASPDIIQLIHALPEPDDEA